MRLVDVAVVPEAGSPYPLATAMTAKPGLTGLDPGWGGVVAEEGDHVPFDYPAQAIPAGRIVDGQEQQVGSPQIVADARLMLFFCQPLGRFARMIGVPKRTGKAGVTAHQSFADKEPKDRSPVVAADGRDGAAMLAQAFPQGRAGRGGQGMGADPNHPRPAYVVLTRFEEEVDAALWPDTPARAIGKPTRAAGFRDQFVQEPVQGVKVRCSWHCPTNSVDDRL